MGRIRTKFLDVLTDMTRLEPDERLIVFCPPNRGLTNFRQSISNMLRSFAPRPPEGFRWRTRVNKKTRGVIIVLGRVSGPGRRSLFALGGEQPFIAVDE